jgi:hypothetical protein
VAASVQVALTVDAHPQISGYMQYSGDGKSVYYPITEKGISNFVKQSLDGVPATQVTDFQDFVSYGYAYDWSNKKLAVTRAWIIHDFASKKRKGALKD